MVIQYFASVHPVDAKHIRYVHNASPRSTESPDLLYLNVCQSCCGISFAETPAYVRPALINLILPILFSSSPRKISQLVIRLIAVQMATLHPFRTRADKLSKD